MVAAVLFLCASLQSASASTAKVTVLLVPTVNDSGDKYEAMRNRQDIEADATLHRLFVSRGFAILPIDRSIVWPNQHRADMTDQDNQNQETLYNLGRTAGAQFVVFTTITRTSRHETHICFVPNMAGFATVKTWILDVPNHRAILSGDTFEGKSTALGESASQRQIRAVRLALESQLKPFFSTFATQAK